MSPTSLREIDSRYPTRAEMIGKEFFFDGSSDLPEGRWKVRQLRDNQFRCTRLTGTGANVKNFDIGYVIKQYMQESDTRHESGWNTPTLKFKFLTLSSSYFGTGFKTLIDNPNTVCLHVSYREIGSGRWGYCFVSI